MTLTTLPLRVVSLFAALLIALLAQLLVPTPAQAQTNYTLTISKSGSGTVTSSPAGINCGSTCSYGFAGGTTVTLTAVPASDAILQSWSGCASSSGNTCTVSITAAKAVYATFAPAQYSFTLYKQGTGAGTVTSSPAGIDCGSTCTANFANGASVTFTATPNAGSVFQNWSGYCTGTTPTCTLTMNKAKYAYANFTPPTMALTVSKSGGGTGTVTSSPAGIDCGSTCTTSFATNSTVTLTATPTADSLFQGWSGCTSTSGATCTVSMTAAKTVRASFVPAQYPLSVTKSGAGTGTVTSSPAGITCGATCAANFANGANVTLAASADTGFTFHGWGGACTGKTPTCTVAMSAARAVTASFGPPITTFLYDANGNPTQVTDPVGNVRQWTYDALDRPYLVKEPHATTIGSTQGQITTGYDGQSQVASVKDPRNLTTSYTLDGLGNLTTLVSPDTGTTTYTYDEAGNPKTRLDARGKLATYAYDALNRISQISHGDQTITYGWDSCTNGLGRLCLITDGSGSTAYAYDAHGRVLQKTQTIGTVSLITTYSYNASGQLTGLVTPGGQTLAYDWANGRVTALRVGGVPLLTNLQYQPFGPLSGGTWGDGRAMIRSHNLAGRPLAYSLGSDPGSGQPDARGLGYDPAGRILAVVGVTDPSLNQTHAYDGLDRLKETRLGNPVTTTATYGHDLSGNRSGKTVNGQTTTYTTQTASNRLTSLAGAETKNFAHDAAGNLIQDGTATYTYDNAGRRTGATVSGQTWQYAYNALGQRVRKSGPTGTTLYAYDEQGRLLGEYGATGQPLQETVWLDDLPVATLRGAAVYYVHADHLGTPRRITRPADNTVMWQWESEPFGYSSPNENPQGQGVFTYNLRFPGQLRDAETGLFYNYFRDYDPSTGRYVQSDPIGLAGGSWSTYTYADNAPTMKTDPLGLFGWPNVHGQWCGPRWTGGFKKSWDQLTADERQKVKPPKDALDACCEIHDKCHADCRAKHPCDMEQQQRCLQSCDRRLYFCSRESGVGGIDGFLIKDYMRKSSPPPEKGACCPN